MPAILLLVAGLVLIFATKLVTLGIILAAIGGALLALPLLLLLIFGTVFYRANKVPRRFG